MNHEESGVPGPPIPHPLPVVPLIANTEVATALKIFSSYLLLQQKHKQAEREARAWRWAAVGLGAIALLAVAGLVASVNRPPPKPLITRVNADGSVAMLGRATADYTAAAPEIEHFLKTWIMRVRAVPADVSRREQNLASAMRVLGPRALAKLKDWSAQSRRPIDSPLTVEIISITAESGERYAIGWNEVTPDPRGSDPHTLRWTAQLTVQQAVPAHDVDLTNPLGLYITDFRWMTSPGVPTGSPSSHQFE